MQLACPVIIEYLAKNSRMPIKKVLAYHGVIISKRLGKSGQSCGGNFLERRLFRFVQAVLTKSNYVFDDKVTNKLNLPYKFHAEFLQHLVLHDSR